MAVQLTMYPSQSEDHTETYPIKTGNSESNIVAKISGNFMAYRLNKVQRSGLSRFQSGQPKDLNVVHCKICYEGIKHYDEIHI